MRYNSVRKFPTGAHKLEVPCIQIGGFLVCNHPPHGAIINWDRPSGALALDILN